MTITVLGIAGSTRRGGNSETLLDQALSGAQEAGADVEKISLLDVQIAPCICPESEDCMLTGICTVIDDMQPIYAKLRGVDLVYLAFPIAFRGVPAQTKNLFDRTQALWVAKYKLGRALRTSPEPGKGFIIATAERSAPDEFDGAIQATRSWLVSAHFQEAARLLVPNVERRGDILDRPDALYEAFQTGSRLVKEATQA